MAHRAGAWTPFGPIGSSLSILIGGLLVVGVVGCGGVPEPTPRPDASSTPEPADSPPPETSPTSPPSEATPSEATPSETDDTGTPIPALPTPAVTPDDTPDAGLGARAWVTETVDELLTGSAATGRVGDIVLANQHLKVVIQQPGRDIVWGQYGGTIIDAALVEDGVPGEDAFGEMSVFFNVAHTVNASVVRVLDDGLSSGYAAVVAEGPDDLFDIINVQAAIDPYGVQLPYDMNEDFPLTIRTTYTLGPDDRYVHVVTEFTNDGEEEIVTPAGDLIDSGGDLEVYVPNVNQDSYSATLGEDTYTYTWGGFGEAEIALPSWFGFWGGFVSYGYHTPLNREGEAELISASIAGVTVTVLGTTRLTDLFTQNDRTLLVIPPQGSASFQRDFIVGRDMAAISDVVYSLRDIDTGVLHGTVTDSETGEALPGVRIAIVKGTEPAAPVTACYTDAEGNYRAELPPGGYGVMAMEGFDFMSDGRPARLEPIPATVELGLSERLDLALEPPAQMTINVYDGTTNERIPAKVTLYGDYETPPAALVDTKKDWLGSGVARVVLLPEGRGTFSVKPGMYDVVVSRGFEYDIHRFEGVLINSEAPSALTAVLTRVVDSAGYISADLHVHGENSPDSPVSFHNRVVSFATEGVEVLVSTDHGFVTDYRPLIEDLGLESELTAIPGDETTTFNMGHFNTFPLEVDLESRTGGALDWTDADNRPIDPNTGEPVDIGHDPSLSSAEDNLSASQIFRALALANPGEQVHQVNHARGELGGYFTQIGLDLSQLGTAAETSADPADFRLPQDVDLFVPEEITAMEIMNGYNLSNAVTLMNDYFGLLNLGYRVAGTGVSDTHKIVRSAPGYARTFVAVPEDSPEIAHFDPNFFDDFAHGINGLAISFGSGLFATVQITGDDGNTHAMGELVTSTGQQVVNVRVQAPEWSGYDTIEVFVNPVVTANVGDTLEFETPADLNPQRTYLRDTDFVVEVVEVPTLRSGGARRLETNLPVSLTLVEDAWVVVTIRGQAGDLKPGHNQDDPPFAFTNPIFIDADGDGLFTPPGKDYVLGSSSSERRSLGQGRGLGEGHASWARTWARLARDDGESHRFQLDVRQASGN